MLLGSDKDYRVLPFPMIYAGQFFDIRVYGLINNALWCQSARSTTTDSYWYYPNGRQVPIFDGPFGDRSAPSPIYVKRFPGRIALARKSGIAGYEGYYKCVISDEKDVRRTLYAAIYTTGAFNRNSEP